MFFILLILGVVIFIIIQMKMLKILKLIDVKIYQNQNWEIYIPAKNEVLIGGLIFLKNWIIRAEKSNALGKLFVKNT